MMNIIIESYVNKLTIYDLKDFALKNDLELNDCEINYFFNLVKNEWKNILKSPEHYLDIIKQKVNSKNYNKIYELYTIYSKKLYH